MEAALGAAAGGSGQLSLDTLHGALAAAGCVMVRHQALTLFRALVRQSGGDPALPSAQAPVNIAAAILCGGAPLL